MILLNLPPARMMQFDSKRCQSLFSNTPKKVSIITKTPEKGRFGRVGTDRAYILVLVGWPIASRSPQGPVGSGAGKKKPIEQEKTMKALTMYRPLNLGDALSDFDNYLESFFGNSLLDPADRIFNHLPAVDVREKEDVYLLEAELPGYDEKNIQVHVDGGNLTIESKQEEEKELKNKDDKDGTFLIRERRSSAFCRSFKLPENADANTVAASFKNGILSLEIKKRSEAQKRVIEIKSN
jgi:HSP20 family protein